MIDNPVTYADRTDLLNLRAMVEDFDSDAAERQTHLLDRLIAAAEADQPPLPEGWVLLRYSDGSHGVFYYPGRGDVLTRYDNGTGGTISVEAVRKDLAPLRPTVTEADVEKAADRARRAYTEAGQAWEFISDSTRQRWVAVARAAFKAAGIEVRS